jgi:hypothetical protein
VPHLNNKQSWSKIKLKQHKKTLCNRAILYSILLMNSCDFLLCFLLILDRSGITAAAAAAAPAL